VFELVDFFLIHAVSILSLRPESRKAKTGTVGLLKNPIPGKMAIENKRVSMAIFAQMVLFQQPHCTGAGERAVWTVPAFAQRTDAVSFRPAEHINPVYARKLRRAHKAGVEILPQNMGRSHRILW
jgi:hypothetical protein